MTFALELRGRLLRLRLGRPFRWLASADRLGLIVACGPCLLWVYPWRCTWRKQRCVTSLSWSRSF
jgi:hypothetical protein